MQRKEALVVSSDGYKVDYRQENLLNLVTFGYGFIGDDTKEKLILQSELEYSYADIVYFAKIEGTEIGSLSVNIRPNNRNDQFWNNIQTTLLDLTEPTLLACYIHGIVVYPSMRVRGIASQLLEKMVEDFNPVVILGQTKTPEAVLTRSKVLDKYGYRTFYGLCEVTPGTDYEKEYEGSDFIKAAFASEEEKPSNTGIYFVNPNILLPYFPKTDEFPPEIQRAFKPIQQAQQTVGQDLTATTVLISIKSSVLR